MKERISTVPMQEATPLPPMDIDPADSEAVRAMVWEKLVTIAATMPATERSLPVLRELMDRLEGKPMQRIKQDTTVSFDLKANTNLLNRFKERLGVKEQIVIEGTTDSGVT